MVDAIGVWTELEVAAVRGRDCIKQDGIKPQDGAAIQLEAVVTRWNKSEVGHCNFSLFVLLNLHLFADCKIPPTNGNDHLRAHRAAHLFSEPSGGQTLGPALTKSAPDQPSPRSQRSHGRNARALRNPGQSPPLSAGAGVLARKAQQPWRQNRGNSKRRWLHGSERTTP
jgi:hypothetical protein